MRSVLTVLEGILLVNKVSSSRKAAFSVSEKSVGGCCKRMINFMRVALGIFKSSSSSVVRPRSGVCGRRGFGILTGTKISRVLRPGIIEPFDKRIFVRPVKIFLPKVAMRNSCDGNKDKTYSELLSSVLPVRTVTSFEARNPPQDPKPRIRVFSGASVPSS